MSIYPLQEFTEEIAGDKAEVTCLVPKNVEPHDYEPKAQDLEVLTKSDAFIYNGLGMESWVDKVNDVIKDKKIPIVGPTKGVEARKEENAIDPHSWLSLKNAEIQSENIKNTLVKLDEKNFVTGHAAFGYLCRDFGLTQKSVENLFGEGEPTPKQLEDLVKFCRESNIKTVFSESLASPKVSETLANEVGAKVVPILTLESKEDDKSYSESMRYNLDEIYKCLENE